MSKKHLDTRLAQMGNQSDKQTMAINTPLYFSTAYKHPGFGQSSGYDYTRTANPTRDVLQAGLADIEEGSAGFATSSGMSAIQMVVELFPAGSHFVTLLDLYGGSYRLFHHYEKQGTYKFDYCLSEDEIRQAVSEDTVAIFLETPTNPMMNEYNIASIAKIAHDQGAILIVDNTFYSPVIQKPLTEGADIVLHSATKYLGGHNDLLAGAVVTNNQEIAEQLTFSLNTTGVNLGAFDSWLLIRGMKTLSLRMERHEKNAKTIVEFLEKSDLVEKVYYTGRGGMVSFDMKDEDLIPHILDNLEILSFAESLGGVESLITYPSVQTHADIPEELRLRYGLTNKMLRISTGIEDTNDLVQDLNQAFTKSVEQKKEA